MKKDTRLNAYCEVYYNYNFYKNPLPNPLKELYNYLTNYIMDEKKDGAFMPEETARKCECSGESILAHYKNQPNSMMFRKCFIFYGENTDRGMIRYMSEWRRIIQSALDWNGVWRDFEMKTWWGTWCGLKVRIIFEINDGDDDNGCFAMLPVENLERRK